MRRTASAMAWVLVAAGLTYVGAAAVTGADRKTPANFSAYASGTPVHIHALQLGPLGPRIADTDLAPSSTSVNTAGLGPSLLNELQEPQQPPADVVAGKNVAAQGIGLQLGLGNAVPNDPNLDQLLLQSLAYATAPPDTPFVPCGDADNKTCQEIAVPADPLAYASVARGEAEAHYEALLARCPAFPASGINNPLGRGKGYVADAQLLNTTMTAPLPDPNQVPLIATDTPGQNVVDSESFTYPYDNGDGTFGLVSEVHELLAPVRIANSLEVRVGGEWVLRAIATGHPAGYRGPGTGGARIEYAPGDPAGSPTPTTPILQILDLSQPIGSQVQGGLNLQDLFGAGGLDIPADPLLHVTLGGPPRAINGAYGSSPTQSTDGTTVSAAVDAALVQVLPNISPGVTGGDIRIGHMETVAQVPVGGFSVNDCGRLRITKSVVGNLTGPFAFHVDCPGVALNADEADFTLLDGQSKVIPVPTGKDCTVKEVNSAGASAVTATVKQPTTPATTAPLTATGVTVPIPDNNQFVDVTVNNLNVGQLQVRKTAQEGLTGPFGFSADCRDKNGAQLPNGTASGQVSRTFTLNPNETKTFKDLPGGTNCTVTETDPHGSTVTRITDSTGPNNTDGKVTIAGGDIQTVTFSNAGPPLIIGKLATGEAAGGKGPFTFHLACTDPNGGEVALAAADADFTLGSGEEHVLAQDVPDNSTCTVTETGSGGATTVTPTTTSGTVSGASVSGVLLKHQTTQVVAFDNNFIAPIKLIVAKKVVGTGSSGPFKFHVTCVSPTNAAVTLAAADTDFTLNDGQSHSIKSIPNGSKCTVAETDSKGAVVSFNDTTAPATDGIVTIPTDGASTVTATNTYVAPSAVQPAVVQPRTVG